MNVFVTLTLNPSLDLSAHVPHVEAGPKLRLEAPSAEPGGGGINVARAGAALGAQVRAVAALGGPSGTRVQELMAGSGVTVVPFDVPGETRICLAVSDQQDHRQFRFVLSGAPWDAASVERLMRCLVDEVRPLGPDPVVVLSGSQPPGVSDTFPQEMIAALTAQVSSARVIVDTSGAALSQLVRHRLVGAHPHVLRMDQGESETLAGAHFATVAASADFAQALAQRGVADAVIVARGSEGSILATRDMRLHCAPPSVEVVSKVGAGDSFTGAFALELARGGDFAQALRLGTAAAASAVTQPGTTLCQAAQTEALARATRLVSVP